MPTFSGAQDQKSNSIFKDHRNPVNPFIRFHADHYIKTASSSQQLFSRFQNFFSATGF